jgi:hypothetical protein
MARWHNKKQKQQNQLSKNHLLFLSASLPSFFLKNKKK